MHSCLTLPLLRHEKQLLGIERIAVECSGTQRGSGAHRGQVLRRQSRMAATGADVRELHRPTAQRSKCKTGAEDLPAPLAMRPVDHQTFVPHVKTSLALEPTALPKRLRIRMPIGAGECQLALLRLRDTAPSSTHDPVISLIDLHQGRDPTDLHTV